MTGRPKRTGARAQRGEPLERIASALAALRRELNLPAERPPAEGTVLPLASTVLGEEEIAEAVLTLLQGRLTMGERVLRFEKAWAEYVGVDHAVMVNSGSSANLIALKALELLRGDRIANGQREVITSPVTWSTSVFPIYDAGCTPHFTDVELGGFTQRWSSASRAVSKKTFALLPVHLMGLPTDVDRWAEAAQDLQVPLIEDCCEAHGAQTQGKRVGGWGWMSTFSFFFSHHLTTIEGGIVCTNDRNLANTLRSLRAHGWIRERSDRHALARRWPAIDPRFLFLHHGYNVRPTEIQGAFGLHQLPRLDAEVARRERLVRSWRTFIEREDLPISVPEHGPETIPSWFGVPLLLEPDASPTRDSLAKRLAARRVESRPIMGGNFPDQPAAARHGFLQTGDLRNAEAIGRRGLYLGIAGPKDEAANERAQVILGNLFRRHRR